MKVFRTITVILLFLVTIFIPTRKVRAKKRISAPFIRQMPELPRGCEVTSLAMLLQHAGVKVNKMTLASEVKKEPFDIGDGCRGNPYEGFVGDMYDFNIPGFGVYHGPIYELANTYLPNRILDLTGKGKNHLYSMLDRGIPVWVITNSFFEPLSEEQFQTWKTKQGAFSLTFEEHSVLITGYTRNEFYIHDPLYNKPHRKIDKDKFIASWKQMGQQAISYVPEGEKAK